MKIEIQAAGFNHFVELLRHLARVGVMVGARVGLSRQPFYLNHPELKLYILKYNLRVLVFFSLGLK